MHAHKLGLFPTYLSLRASEPISSSVISANFTSSLVFLLNIMDDDLSLLIVCPEQFSYNERIFCTCSALPSLILKSSSESSANKR
jgi:hypothetical protein